MSKKQLPQQSAFATASFYTGLLGIIVMVLSFLNFSNLGIYVTMAMGVAVVLLGILGLRQIKQEHREGKALAITGIVFGGICILALPFNLFVWVPTVVRVVQEIKSAAN
jgi:uncharacterized membrane protein YdcZ (DUF606 family)